MPGPPHLPTLLYFIGSLVEAEKTRSPGSGTRPRGFVGDLEMETRECFTFRAFKVSLL